MLSRGLVAPTASAENPPCGLLALGYMPFDIDSSHFHGNAIARGSRSPEFEDHDHRHYITELMDVFRHRKIKSSLSAMHVEEMVLLEMGPLYLPLHAWIGAADGIGREKAST